MEEAQSPLARCPFPRVPVHGAGLAPRLESGRSNAEVKHRLGAMGHLRVEVGKGRK